MHSLFQGPTPAPRLCTHGYLERGHSILVGLLNVSICIDEALYHFHMAVQGSSPLVWASLCTLSSGFSPKTYEDCGVSA